VQVNAPHLSVDGMPLQASAFLVSDGRSFDFNFPLGYDVRTERWSTPESALNARRVDGRMADPIILGKIPQAIVPAVRKFAEQNQALFWEAERRKLHNEVAGLEREVEHNRGKLQEKERELAGVTGQLKGLR